MPRKSPTHTCSSNHECMNNYGTQNSDLKLWMLLLSTFGVQFWWGCANGSFSFLFWAHRSAWYPVWASAVVAHLLQGVQRTLLHSLVVSSVAFISAPHNVAILLSPLAFLLQTICLWTPEMVLCENPSRSAVCDVQRPPATMPCSKCFSSWFWCLV